MAKQTYVQLQRQIAALNQQAEQLRRNEIGEIVAKIKEAIKAYDISAADLYGSGGGVKLARKSKTMAKSEVTSKSKSANKTAKYADGQGGEWVGRGPRPKWLRDALAAGRSLEEFATDDAASDSSSMMPSTEFAATAGRKKAKGKRSGGANKASGAKKVLFSDGQGKQWSGRGPKPGWLKTAVESGRSIDEFKV